MSSEKQAVMTWLLGPGDLGLLPLTHTTLCDLGARHIWSRLVTSQHGYTDSRFHLTDVAVPIHTERT